MSVTIVNNMKKGGEVTHVLDWAEGTCGWDSDGDPVVRVIGGAVGSNINGEVVTWSEDELQEDKDEVNEFAGTQNPSGTCTITFN